jgi:hypothetical protein
MVRLAPVMIHLGSNIEYVWEVAIQYECPEL